MGALPKQRHREPCARAQQMQQREAGPFGCSGIRCKVDGAQSGDPNDELSIGWIENAGEPSAYVRIEARPMSNTFSSPGVVTTISDVFEVPINYNILTRIKYTQQAVASPGAYYIQANITGMSVGNGVSNGTAANSTGATALVQPSCTSPGAGAATAGVVNLTTSASVIP